MNYVATEMVVHPTTGRILAIAGQPNPPLLLREMGDREPGDWPAWLVEAVGTCWVQEEPFTPQQVHQAAMEGAAKVAAAGNRGTGDQEPFDPYTDRVGWSAEQYGGWAPGGCRHGYTFASECPTCTGESKQDGYRGW